MTAAAIAASEIAEQLLNQTGKALMSGDVDSFAQCFALPHYIETFDGSSILRNRHELEQRFNRVRSYFIENSVTELVRHVLEADFVDGETIQSSHQTRVVSGTTLIQAPFPNLTLIKRIGGAWLAQTTQYAIADSEKHNAALCGAPSPERSYT